MASVEAFVLIYEWQITKYKEKEEKKWLKIKWMRKLEICNVYPDITGSECEQINWRMALVA